MNRAIIDSWTRFVDGQPDPEPHDNPVPSELTKEVREALQADLRIDGLLRGQGRSLSATDAERFVNGVTRQLHKDRDADQFTEVVRRKLQRQRTGRRVGVGALCLALSAAAWYGRRHRSVDQALSSKPDGGVFPIVHNADPKRIPLAPLIAPDEPPLGAPAALEKDRVVLRWDFEDGSPPKELSQGQVVDGPPRDGSRHAALGVFSFSPFAGNQYTVAIVNRKDFSFTFTGTQKLSFDYWVGKGVRFIAILIYNPTQVHSFRLALEHPVVEEWTSVTVRLKDLPPITRTPQVLPFSARCEPGDTIDAMVFMAGQVGGPPFYIDNIVVSDGRSE